jgi:cytoskeletal protein CcmA (bactofilin family)
MSDVQIPGGPYINSIIGEGTRFNGEFDLNGLLRIDGDFCGTVRTEGKVLVGKNGRAECTVYAGTVVIGGIVRGNIFANEKVVILSTGIVLGNIHSPRFIVEEGVIFNGMAKIVQEGKGSKTAAAKPSVEQVEPESYAPPGSDSSQDQEEAKRSVSATGVAGGSGATG